MLLSQEAFLSFKIQLSDDVFLCEFWHKVGRSSKYWVNCCNRSPAITVYLFVWIRVLTSMKMKNRSRIFAEFYLIPVISAMKWALLASVTSDSAWSLFPPLLLSIELYCSFKLNQYSAFVLLWLGKYYSWLNQQWAMLIFPFLYNDIFSIP